MNADSSTHLVSERQAFGLALFGYVPFLALTLAIGPFNSMLSAWIGQYALPGWLFAHVLAVYGAVILSFLGGVRWGVAMVGTGDNSTRTRELFLSVVPSLIGWAAVFVARDQGLFLLAVAFVVQGWWDIRLVSSKRAPQWFGKLRLVLTALVSTTLLLASYWAA